LYIKAHYSSIWHEIYVHPVLLASESHYIGYTMHSDNVLSTKPPWSSPSTVVFHTAVARPVIPSVNSRPSLVSGFSLYVLEHSARWHSVCTIREEMWFKTTADGERIKVRGIGDVRWKIVPQTSGCDKRRFVADSGQTS